jgi:hypothetical protein
MTEQARQAAGTATEEGKHVAATAGQEAKQVAAEVRYQTRNLVGELRTQATQQSRSQRDRLAHTLHELSDELDKMAASAGGSGLATDLVHQASQRARDFGTRIENREPGDLLDDVRAFARRRPGAFLLGAAALGVVAGRLTRGGVASQQEQSQAARPMTSAQTWDETTPLPPGPQPVVPPTVSASAGATGVEPGDPWLEPGRPGSPGRTTGGMP